MNMVNIRRTREVDIPTEGNKNSSHNEINGTRVFQVTVGAGSELPAVRSKILMESFM